jgi:activator of HSP90 ATPase
MNALMERFKTEQDEKNHTLIRNDIIQNMKYLYDYYDDDTIKQTALDLIETVDEDNYKKKYLRIFK